MTMRTRLEPWADGLTPEEREQRILAFGVPEELPEWYWRIALRSPDVPDATRVRWLAASLGPDYDWRGEVGARVRGLTPEERESYIEASQNPKAWYGDAAVYAPEPVDPERREQWALRSDNPRVTFERLSNYAPVTFEWRLRWRRLSGVKDVEETEP